jgi:flagellin
MAAGASLSDYLNQMKQDALAAADTSISPTTRQKYSDDYDALITQITNVVKSATFDGTNIIDNTSTGYAPISALANADGSVTVNVNTEDLSPAALGVTVGSLSSAASAATESASVDTAIANLTAAMARLGVGSKALDNQLTFVGKLQDSLNTGVGNLVDADVAKESANLQALQVKQQLSAQALSIANSAPQIVLSLFK